MTFYAVRVGRKPRVYTSWPKCKEQVHKFPSPVYKGFQSEREAQDFLAGPMPRWYAKRRRRKPAKDRHGRRKERFITNPSGRTEFYDGPEPPWTEHKI